MVCTIVFSLFVIPVSAVTSSTPTSSTPTSSTPTSVFPFKPNLSLLPTSPNPCSRFVFFSHDGEFCFVHEYPVGTSFVATPGSPGWSYLFPTTDCDVDIYRFSTSDNFIDKGYISYSQGNALHTTSVCNSMFYSSDDDILNKDGTIFFQKPLPPTALVAGAGESLTPQTLLTSMIGLIKPLVLLLIGLAGFWMCWHFLLRALRRA